MRTCLYLIAAVALAKDPKPPKNAVPAAGVKTPGVLIPAASLKAEAEFTLSSPPAGFHFSDAVSLAEAGGIRRFDAKTNKAFEPSRDIKEVAKPCGGLVNAFGALWTATCGTPALAKVELPPPPREGRGGGGRGMTAKPDAAKPDAAKPEAEKAEAKLAAKPEPPKAEFAKPSPPPAKPKPAVFISLETAPAARAAVAASEDSVWLLADSKTSLQRIDPKEHKPVADLRLPSACASILYAEAALWVACPGETKLLKVDPKTNLVDKRIEVAAQPVALAAGEGSIWVLGRKEGKISRVDPKTNKVTATIELGVPNAEGTLAFGEGALWASVPGFPVMRIAPGTDKVVQQFHGEGGGLIAFGAGSVWVGSEKSSVVRRYDPKRIQATLAE